MPLLNPLLSFDSLSRGMPRVPTAAKTYIDSVLLGKKGTITEKDFTPDELRVMRSLVMHAPLSRDSYGPVGPLKNWSPSTNPQQDYVNTPIPGTPGAVHYDTYGKAFGHSSQLVPHLGLNAMRTPEGNVMTTLGQFNYKTNPNGDTTVTDKYKFNNFYAGAWNSMPMREKAQMAIRDPYTALRSYGETILPEGTGRDVRVQLPSLDQMQASPEPSQGDKVRQGIRRAMIKLGINTVNRGDADASP